MLTALLCKQHSSYAQKRSGLFNSRTLCLKAPGVRHRAIVATCKRYVAELCSMHSQSRELGKLQ